MDRALVLFVIGLVFGGGIGFVTAAGNNITLDGHDHAEHVAQTGHDTASHAAMGHGAGDTSPHDHSEILSMPEGPGTPSLEVAVVRDPASGWNLNVSVQNFRFAPEHASKDHVAGEGHAHVYVNGSKIARLYGPWLHLTTLPDGEAVVEVTLNTNDHRQLAVEGMPVKARVKVISN